MNFSCVGTFTRLDKFGNPLFTIEHQYAQSLEKIFTQAPNHKLPVFGNLYTIKGVPESLLIPGTIIYFILLISHIKYSDKKFIRLVAKQTFRDPEAWNIAKEMM
jgi:hypothetical protein